MTSTDQRVRPTDTAPPAAGPPRSARLTWVTAAVILFMVGPGVLFAFAGKLPFAVFPPAIGIFMLFFALTHGATMLGWRPAAVMVVSGLVTAYVLEEIGVHTGIIFGHYYFTHLMGPKLDVIPIATVFCWVGMLYVAWVVTNFIMDGAPVPGHHSHVRILMGAVIGALIVTTVDVSADPLAAKYGLWVWQGGGSFFGVPIHNYVGWFIVAFVTYVIHGYQMRHESPEPVERAGVGVRRWAIVPILMYGMDALVFMAANFDGKLGLVSVYLLGIPFLAALWRWITWYDANRDLKREGIVNG